MVRCARRTFAAGLIGAGALLTLQRGPALARQASDDDYWADLKSVLFQDEAIVDGADLLAIEAPPRAFDAAVVPVSIRGLKPQAGDERIESLHLVIDKNPSPVAAIVRYGKIVGNAGFSTRVRVNEYTNVRAIARTADGRLRMVARYVKAAGGCSAPGMKDKAAVMARLGKMKLKEVAPFAPGEVGTAQLLVSHPNYTGLQMDQLTRNWIPPDYVDRIAIRLDGEPLLDLETDISISEDPAFTFNYEAEGAKRLAIAVHDTEGREFKSDWPLGSAS